MKYVHMFQWNIPADNHYLGRKDWYINFISEWDGSTYYNNGTPIVCVQPINIAFVDLRQVKNWALASTQIEKIAETHFAEIAKSERLAKARAELIAAGEPTGIPTLDLYSEKEKDLIIQGHLS